MRLSLILQRQQSWKTVIGLELHVQIQATRSRTSWDDDVNSNVSLFDVGYPGTLPSISPQVVKQGLSTALALNCEIPLASQFDRKHYFYHDQPLGYQITQHYHPLALKGYLEIPTTPPKRIRIQQIQLEQDTAKTATAGEAVLIDYNRAGTGLMEIVTEPDLESAEEAALFLKTIRAVLRRIGASGADMEKGSLRVDCNISIHREGEPRGGRVELKNLAVMNQLQKAVSFEVSRHQQILSSGQAVAQETRGFDQLSGETHSLRSKEEVKDYRYMPDGNLPILRLDPSYLDRLRSDLPELPYPATIRLVDSYPGLTSEAAAALLALDPEGFAGINFFERAVASSRASADSAAGEERATEKREKMHRALANWTINYVAGALAKEGKTWGAAVDGGGEEAVTADELADLVRLIEQAKVTHASGQKLVLLLAGSPPSPSSRVPSLLALHPSLLLPSDSTLNLPALVSSTFSSLPKAVENVTSGRKPSDIHKLVGGVMKAAKGQAEPKEVMRLVREALGSLQG